MSVTFAKYNSNFPQLVHGKRFLMRDLWEDVAFPMTKRSKRSPDQLKCWIEVQTLLLRADEFQRVRSEVQSDVDLKDEELTCQMTLEMEYNLLVQVDVLLNNLKKSINS